MIRLWIEDIASNRKFGNNKTFKLKEIQMKNLKQSCNKPTVK